MNESLLSSLQKLKISALDCIVTDYAFKGKSLQNLTDVDLNLLRSKLTKDVHKKKFEARFVPTVLKFREVEMIDALHSILEKLQLPGLQKALADKDIECAADLHIPGLLRERDLDEIFAYLSQTTNNFSGNKADDFRDWLDEIQNKVYLETEAASLLYPALALSIKSIDDVISSSMEAEEISDAQARLKKARSKIVETLQTIFDFLQRLGRDQVRKAKEAVLPKFQWNPIKHKSAQDEGLNRKKNVAKAKVKINEKENKDYFKSEGPYKFDDKVEEAVNPPKGNDDLKERRRRERERFEKLEEDKHRRQQADKERQVEAERERETKMKEEKQRQGNNGWSFLKSAISVVTSLTGKSSPAKTANANYNQKECKETAHFEKESSNRPSLVVKGITGTYSFCNGIYDPSDDSLFVPRVAIDGYHLVLRVDQSAHYVNLIDKSTQTKVAYLSYFERIEDHFGWVLKPDNVWGDEYAYQQTFKIEVVAPPEQKTLTGQQQKQEQEQEQREHQQQQQQQQREKREQQQKQQQQKHEEQQQKQQQEEQQKQQLKLQKKKEQQRLLEEKQHQQAQLKQQQLLLQKLSAKESCGPEALVVSGISGHFSFCNGFYHLSEDVHRGKPVFFKRERDIWIHYHQDNDVWFIKGRKSKSKDEKTYASFKEIGSVVGKVHCKEQRALKVYPFSVSVSSRPNLKADMSTIMPELTAHLLKETELRDEEEILRGRQEDDIDFAYLCNAEEHAAKRAADDSESEKAQRGAAAEADELVRVVKEVTKIKQEVQQCANESLLPIVIKSSHCRSKFDGDYFFDGQDSSGNAKFIRTNTYTRDICDTSITRCGSKWIVQRRFGRDTELLCYLFDLPGLSSPVAVYCDSLLPHEKIAATRMKETDASWQKDVLARGLERESLMAVDQGEVQPLRQLSRSSGLLTSRLVEFVTPMDIASPSERSDDSDSRPLIFAKSLLDEPFLTDERCKRTPPPGIISEFLSYIIGGSSRKETFTAKRNAGTLPRPPWRP